MILREVQDITRLIPFIRESNRIERIEREVTSTEIDAYQDFLELEFLTVANVEDFVRAVEPGARLRRDPMDMCMVGDRVCPEPGTTLVADLMSLLEDINKKKIKALDAHVRYEWLHPFTDGNGRSGRAIWLWQMEMIGYQYSFLHLFYYQALDKLEEPHDRQLHNRQPPSQTEALPTGDQGR